MRRQRRPRILTTCAIAASVLAVSCSSTHRASTSSTASPEAATHPTTTRPVGIFVEASCDDVLKIVAFAPPHTMTCGRLEVPENRAKPHGRKVRLAVVRFLSHSATPKPDPVVYLHGGPGIATLPDGVGQWLSSPVLATRDLIVFDQRGSGRSEPDLQCPERERAFIDALGGGANFPAHLSAFDSAIAACYQRLTSTGVDLDQYNTAQDAADLADLRVAMGIDQWNLWGVSYGTRLALEEMRTHPKGIRSVVLDSVYPPSAGRVDDVVKSSNAAFEALVKGCRDDAACHRAFPDINGDLAGAVDHLDRHPMPVQYMTTGYKEPRTLRITGDAAVGGLFTAMYSTQLIAQLPMLVHQLAAGADAIIEPMVDSAIPFVNSTSEGAYLSFECADNGAKIDDNEVAALRSDPGRGAFALLAGWNLFCKSWPVAALPTGFGDVVHSDIPTLVIAGEYDPVTPAATSKATADALAHSVFLEVPRGGHAPESLCTASVYGRFFDDLDRVDTSCAATMRPIPFATR